MKEPWKKTHKGKVVITLNDEKTEPTEVELPVDLNWTSADSGLAMPQCRMSVSKTIVLLSFVFLLGLSTYALWKVQELEDTMEADRGFFNLFRHTLPLGQNQDKPEPIVMILEDKDDFPKLLRGERAEALIGSPSSKSKRDDKDRDDDDLKISESKANSLAESRDVRDEPESPKAAEKPKESSKDDPEEWIKPLVETFDIFGNHPIEDHFLHNVLSKLFLPESNFEVFELNKDKMLMKQKFLQKQQSRPALPPPIENIIMKTLLPPMSSFKIFHVNEPRQDHSPIFEAEQQQPKNFLKHMLPPLESGLLRTLNHLKVIQLNDQKQQQQQQPQQLMDNPEEDMPKITIQSIKLKLLPLPLSQEEFVKKDPSSLMPMPGPGNFEMIRLNEPSGEPSSSEEQQGAKMPMLPHNFNPLPLPVQDMIMKSLMPIKNFEIFPMGMDPPHREPLLINAGESVEPQPQKQAPLPIPFQDIMMKTFMPAPHTFDIPLSQMIQEQQQQSEDEAMPKKIMPLKAVKMIGNAPPVLETLLKSAMPVGDVQMMQEQEQQQQSQQEQQEQQEAQQQQDSGKDETAMKSEEVEKSAKMDWESSIDRASN